MSTFAYYNYQFSKIVLPPVQGELFTRTAPPVRVDENFVRRQEILSELLAADCAGSRKIVFRSPRGNKEHLHSFLTPYTDGIAVMKISNRRVHTTEKKDFTEESHNEYPACIVVIDNRPGIQRMVIEKRTQAFASVNQVRDILQTTFRRLLRPYGLSIAVDQLHTRSAFWSVANDERQYPLGFHRIRFYLPHLNLERLKQAMTSYLVSARESYDSDLSWTQTATKGGKLKFDEKDSLQSSLVNTLMEDVGGNNVITLYPNGKGQEPVHVGMDDYRMGEIGREVFEKLKEDDPADKEKAMDQIKCFTKRYID